MKWHGSTNKSPTKLNTAKIKFNPDDLFTNGKNHRGKTKPSDFKVTIPKNLLLSITSDYKYKESYQTLWPIQKYKPTIELLPQYPIGLVL